MQPEAIIGGACPIDRLSEDTFALILEKGMEIADPFERVLFTLRVMSTCRTWRAVSLNMPSLWSTVYITIPRAPPLHVLQSTIARSAAKKLHIWIDWAHRGPPRDPTYIHFVMRLLVQEMHRWRTLVVYWDLIAAETLEDTFAALLQGRASFLEELRLSCLDLLPLSESRRSLDFFDADFTAPQLRSLVLDSMPSGFDLTKVGKRFPSIESLIWEEGSRTHWWMNGRQFLETLKPLQRLRRLVIDGPNIMDTDGHPSDDTEPGMQPMEALENLELANTSLHLLSDILAALTAPRLHTITFRDTGLDEYQPFYGFWQHTTRFPSLRTSRLELNAERLPDAEDIWNSFGFSSCLQIKATGHANIRSGIEFLQALSLPSEDAWLFPQLESLSVYWLDPGSGMPIATIRQLVASRIEFEGGCTELGVSRLQTLRLYNPSSIDMEYLEYFRESVHDFHVEESIPAQWSSRRRGAMIQMLGLELVSSES